MAIADDRDLQRWLIDLHAVEQQAMFQMRRARCLVGDDTLRGYLDQHLQETAGHRAAVRERLAGRGRTASTALDLAVTANRLAFLLYTALAPDAPGKLLVDSFAYEFLEIAAYRMLAHAARRAGDEETAAMATAICAQEQAMAARLATRFDRALSDSRERGDDRIEASLRAHLRDAHALETQTALLLAVGARAAGDPRLAAHMRGQSRRSRDQARRLAARLRELDAGPAPHKSGAMGVAGCSWAALWAVQRYAPAKLTCFGFAALHLEIASYELLTREASLAGDDATRALAVELLGQEREAAQALGALLEIAADAALEPRGRHRSTRHS